jgi:NAD(P)-dependent dehydrogenase (short-subunit alcohol dehydrogenase family)
VRGTAVTPARRVLVTGAAGGLGLHIAQALAAQGFEVLLLDRNAAGGAAAVARIRSAMPGARVQFHALDLADLDAVRAFAVQLAAQPQPLDLLVNNAGLLPPLRRTLTPQGHELCFGVGHLAHFVLTAGLLPALRRSAQPRVVSVSSIAHANARLDFEDLSLAHGYTPTRAYAATKLACLLFAFELQRRAQAAGSSLLSVAAHPGIARTTLGAHWDHEPRRSLRDRAERLAYHLAMRWFSQSVAAGAACLMHAASAPVRAGAFYGPSGFRQFRGTPAEVQPAARALNPATAARLWKASEALTGVWPVLADEKGAL